MDDGRSAIEPHVGRPIRAHRAQPVERDDPPPLTWLFPWLLALAGIVITLLLAS